MWAGGSGQLCGWTQDKQKDQFDWSIGSGGTPSVKTGPKFDHTLKTKQGMIFFVFLFVFALSRNGATIKTLLWL